MPDVATTDSAPGTITARFDHIGVITVGPDDALVATVPPELDPDEAREVLARLRHTFPGHPVVVVTPDVDLASIPEVTLRQLSHVLQLEQRLEALEGADRRAQIAEAALAELLTFVVTELDRIPAPWPSYFSDHQHIALAERLAEEGMK